MRFVRRATLGAALAAAVAFAGYALARTARDATIQAAGFSANRGLHSAFASCPPGRRAVGGGVVESGRRFVYVGSSGPLDASGAGVPLDPSAAVANTKDGDKAGGWYAGVSNASSKSVHLKALALCSKASDARIEAKGFSAGGRDTGVAVAKCPSGKWAVGGGVVQSNWPDNRVLASGPLDATGVIANTKDGDKAKRWYAAVHNLPARRVHFKVFALCSANSRARIVATRFSVGSGRTGHAFVKCPARKRALGGGIIQFGPAKFLRVLASAPLDASGVPSKTKDGDKAKRWYAAIKNRNPHRVRFKVLAICERG
jgi:hypothetical protein